MLSVMKVDSIKMYAYATSKDIIHKNKEIKYIFYSIEI